MTNEAVEDCIRILNNRNALRDQRLQAAIALCYWRKPVQMAHVISALRHPWNADIGHEVCRNIFPSMHWDRSSMNIYAACTIEVSDLDFFKSSLPKRYFIELLEISALNRNGYVRERTVRLLAESGDEEAIRPLIHRLKDSVKVVREQAAAGMEQFKDTKYMRKLISNLPLLDQLTAVKRVDLTAFHADIIDFMVTQIRAHIVRDHNFSGFYENRTRAGWSRSFFITRLLAREDERKEDILDIVIRDPTMSIRKMAFAYFDRLTVVQIAGLLGDGSGDIRLMTLMRVQDREVFPELIVRYLDDPSAMVRHFARSASQVPAVEVSALYLENIRRAIRLERSLKGLGELGMVSQVDLVAGYLTHERGRVQAAAFCVLVKFGDNRAYPWAIENLDSRFPVVRRAVVNYLKVIPGPERQAIVHRAWDCYRRGDRGVKESARVLLSRLKALKHGQ